LTRAIVRAQRAHRRDESAADAEPAEDRDAKPANVSQPAAPAPVEEPAKLPPLHRHANDNVPCPVADCGDPSAAYTATLPVELRALCKRHRDNAQANRSKGMTVADALETVLASGRARLARANAAATKPPVVEAPAVDPRMVADAPGPQVELTDERVAQLTTRLRAAVDEALAEGRTLRTDVYPLGHVPRFATPSPGVDPDEATALRAFLRGAEEKGLGLQLVRDDGARVRIPSEKALALAAGGLNDAEPIATPPPIALDDAALAPIFDRLDAVAAAATAPSDALTRADFAMALRAVVGALDVAIARLESPR
jgi:hypothetical protein